MWTELFYLYCTSVVAFLFIGIGIALYEQYLITSRIVDYGLWVGNLENLGHLVFIALVPIVNVFAAMLSIGYFMVEHAPYIISDFRRKRQNDLDTKKPD